MKVTVEIEIDVRLIKDLKLIRSYFGRHDKTQLEHLSYAVLSNLIQEMEKAMLVKQENCEHKNEIFDTSISLYRCPDCGQTA